MGSDRAWAAHLCGPPAFLRDLTGGLAVGYDPEPLDPPAAGSLLICCSRPTGDVVIDL
ncbi:MAG TPA: hypothetical protein VF912_21570 [Anaeromyxobacter sp.]